MKKDLKDSPFENHGRLVHVSDSDPGISRHRAGRGFYYRHPGGRKVADEQTLARIRFLAIPPAYENVWICATPNGHLQATGIDDRGRKQYRYHPLWMLRRQEKKYQSLIDFARCLPQIRRQVTLDLGRSGLPRERVVAAAIRLLEKTRIRIGNEDYARENGSFGLSTLRPRHVKIDGPEIRFKFKGKGGKPVTAETRHPAIASILTRCEELPGRYLFSYRASDGSVCDMTSGDVNEYLHSVSGSDDISAKDFRTWSGTVVCAQTLAELGPAETGQAFKKNLATAVQAAAEALQNQPATCRAYYVHPRVIRAYKSGKLEKIFSTKAPLRPAPAGLPKRYHLNDDERRVLKLLES